MPRMPQKWYNMQQIDMSNEKPMVSAANAPRVRYSAAYSTGREFGKKCYCVTLTVAEGSDPLKSSFGLMSEIPMPVIMAAN